MINGGLAILGGAWHALTGVSFLALGVALALHLGKLLAEARSWHAIVSHAHRPQHVRFRTTCGAFVGSIGANAVLPARVGEALRVGVVRRGVPGSSVVTIAATIVLETLIEVAFGLGVIVAVILGGRSLGTAGPPGAGLTGLASQPAAIAVVVGLGAVGVALGLAFRQRVRSLLERMAAGFAILRAPAAFVTRVLSWKVVAWGLRLAAIYAFLVAFHVPAAPWTALAVVAAQNVAASIPLLPGNAGTQQAAIAVALAGTASATALLGFGLGMQVATTVVDLAVGVAAIGLVADRRELADALAALRPRRRPRPLGAQP